MSRNTTILKIVVVDTTLAKDGSLFLSTMHLPLKLIESNRTLFPFLVDILSPYEIRFSELNPE